MNKIQDPSLRLFRGMYSYRSNTAELDSPKDRNIPLPEKLKWVPVNTVLASEVREFLAINTEQLCGNLFPSWISTLKKPAA